MASLKSHLLFVAVVALYGKSMQSAAKKSPSKSYNVLTYKKPIPPFSSTGAFTLSDDSKAMVFVPSDGSSVKSGGFTEVPESDAAKSPSGAKKVYYSNRASYLEVTKILDTLDLSGVPNQLKPHARQKMFDFKGNVLALSGNHDNFNQIRFCFLNFRRVADKPRNNLIQMYRRGSTRSALDEYSKQLSELASSLEQCIATRSN